MKMPDHYQYKRHYLCIKRGHPLYLKLLLLRLKGGYAHEYTLAVIRSLGAYDYIRVKKCPAGGFSALLFDKSPDPFMYFATKEKRKWIYKPDYERLAFLRTMYFPRLHHRFARELLPMYYGYTPTIYFGDQEIVLESPLDAKIDGAIRVTKSYVQKCLRKSDRMYNKIPRSTLYRYEHIKIILPVLQRYPLRHNDIGDLYQAVFG